VTLARYSSVSGSVASTPTAAAECAARPPGTFHARRSGTRRRIAVGEAEVVDLEAIARSSYPTSV
jgi:hypothetical protein